MSVEDLTPLADRIRVLLLLRGAIVLVVLGLGALPRVRTQTWDTYLAIVGIYAAGAFLIEGARRLLKRNLGLLAVGLLLDGAYLVAVAWASGGLGSPLLTLLELDTVAVTLLASYRTGLKLAFWNGLLLDGLYQLHLTPHADALRDLVIAISSLWGLVLGAATFSAVNERELRRRRVDLQALVTLSASLDRASGPETMAQVLARQGSDNFLAARAAVFSARADAFELLATHGETGEVPSDIRAGAAVNEAWLTSAAVLLKKADPETDPDLVAIFPNGSYLVVLPMVAEGKPVGALILELGRAVGNRVERRLVDTAGQFAAQAALAIENARLMREVGRLAATDALTGLANRRTLATDIDRALSRARRTGRPVSMVLVDVDHFKSVNDRFGHRTGDELLRDVAGVLASCAGGSATAARYGGEEFALLLPDADAERARKTAEAVRRAVPRGTDPSVTVSAGIATVLPGEGPVPDLVAEADRALYAAKRSGRDRVVHVEELPEDLWVELAHPA